LLTVGGLTQPITNVSVSFYMTHTFDADLTISLVGPDGTTIR
jgi:subtilisin-like proprotein convertase family protein